MLTAQGSLTLQGAAFRESSQHRKLGQGLIAVSQRDGAWGLSRCDTDPPDQEGLPSGFLRRRISTLSHT